MYLLLVFVSIVAGIIIFAAYDRPYYLASGTCSTAMIIIAGIWGALGLIMMALSIYALWNVQDALFLKSELKIDLGLGLPLFIAWVILLRIDLSAAYYSVLVTIFVVHVSSVLIPIILSYTWDKPRSYRALGSSGDRLQNYPSKRVSMLKINMEEDLGRSSQSQDQKRDPLRFVMDNPDLLAAFEMFCVKSFCIESLLCCIALNKFRKEFDANRAADESKWIMDTFLINNSPHQINLDDIITTEIIEKINENNIKANLFWDAEKSIKAGLTYGTLRLWLNSETGKRALAKAGVTEIYQFMNS